MSGAIEPDEMGGEGGAAPGTSIELLGRMALERAPAEVLRDAEAAATALMGVLLRKPDPVMMNGHQYLEFEDWQTVARFYGVSARLEGTPEYVEFFGDVRGFRAEAVAVSRDGEIVSRASAYCLTDEEKWRSRPKYEWHYVLRNGTTSLEDPGKDEMEWEDNPKKPGGRRPVRRRVMAGEETVPLFQIASMAQTRACAKALRNVFAWVAVLAGVKPTPAEELTGGVEPSVRRSATPKVEKREATILYDAGTDPAMKAHAPARTITKDEADYLFRLAGMAGFPIEHDAEKKAWITVTDEIAGVMKIGRLRFPLRDLSASAFDRLVRLVEEYVDERRGTAAGPPSGPMAPSTDPARSSRMDARESATPENAVPLFNKP